MVAHADFTVTHLALLLQHEVQHGLAINPWVRLLAMLAPAQRTAVAAWVTERWKLSRAERDLLISLAAPAAQLSIHAVKEWLRTESLAIAAGRLQLALVDGRVEPAAANELFTIVREWKAPLFPLSASDLIAHGFSEGKALGDQLRTLENAWIASDYQLDKPALLARLTMAKP